VVYRRPFEGMGNTGDLQTHQGIQQYSTIEECIWRSCMKLSRPAMCLFTQTITGHNSLNKHLTRIGKASDPNCLLCGEEEDTGIHVLAVCPNLVVLQLHTFHCPELLLEELGELELADVARFIRESGRCKLAAQ